MSKVFYSYIHCRDTGVPFYVGKGHGRRAFDLTDRSDWHKRITAKNKEVLVGVIECSSEKIAFNLERGIIKCLRRMGVELCNMTDGGEGASGYNPPLEVRKKLSEAGKGRVVSVTTRAKQSEARKAQILADPMILTNLSRKLKGRVFSDEHVEKLREAQRRSYASSPERAMRISAGNKGKVISEEARAKVSAALRRTFSTPEGKAALANRPRRRMSEETKRKIATKALERHLADPSVLLNMSLKAAGKL